MSYSPCLLIPIYNHGERIAATVASLLAYGLPILIVDDGSDAATQRVLAQLANEQPTLRLARRAQNGGKGAAVMDGMRLALAAGYSHALQIDADGQHDTTDVARFLELGAAHPQALVCGQPVYDASVPKGRLYGRYVTHFWVAVETLGQARIDTMCGFRLYPLAACCALIDRVRLPTRMDFDIEIVVRLAWAGVDFVTLPTRVTYPAGGLSHFDLLRDNVRISLMHTRLTCGMLPRAPLLLARRLRLRPRDNERAHGSHWSRLAERGSLLGIRIVAACYRLFGERAARALLKPITGYFLLTGSAARAASLAYLRRVHARQGKAPPTWRDSFLHMHAFAGAGLDKLAAWLGGIDSRRVDFAGRDELLQLMASGRGAVLIGAHLGNLEMTRALAVNERRATVNAVVYSAHAQRFNQMLKAVNADFGVNLIEVAELGADTAITLRQKIDDGELVVIVGDRTPPSERSSGRVSAVDFLGAPAPFAHGPWILASLLDCPVYLFFCLRDAQSGDYRVHLERYAERIELPRGQRPQRLREIVQRYAQRLEHYCLQAPEQWFNFYDFWQPVAGGDGAREVAKPSD